MKIEDLNEIINKRVQTRKKNSYTNKLLKLGPKKIAQKFGEESSELIIDYLKGSKKRTIEEAVDVIYHLLVLTLLFIISFKSSIFIKFNL